MLKMNTKTESALQKHLKRWCERYGIACYKFASPSRRGVPDLILIYKGRVVFVELKSPAKTGKLSTLQRYELKLLTLHGAEVYVIDDYDQANAIIDDLRFEQRPARGSKSTVRLRPYTPDS